MALKAEIAAKKVANGPAKSTRSQTSNRNISGVVSRLLPEVHQESSNCFMTVSDGMTSIKSSRRCDDGSDSSIVSPMLTEAATIKGIGKIVAIEKFSLAVALKKDISDSAEKVSLSRTWAVQPTILHIASGNLALRNILFLVEEDHLACKALLIGRPVLQNLRIDSHTLLDINRFALNGLDCSEVGNTMTTSVKGYVSCLIIACINHIFSDTERTQTPEDRPRVVCDMA